MQKVVIVEQKPANTANGVTSSIIDELDSEYPAAENLPDFEAASTVTQGSYCSERFYKVYTWSHHGT